MYIMSSEVSVGEKRCNLLVVIWLVLQLVSWVCVASSSRPFFDPDCDSPTIHQPSGTTQESRILGIKWSSRKVVRGRGVVNERGATRSRLKMRKLIGSRPPRCEHKCYGCSPCEATQVPALQIQFANYVPQGWICKCGPSFYTP